MSRSLCAVVLVLAPLGAAAADDWHYETKADARADRRSPGPQAASVVPPLPDVGGENCAAATVITSLPFTDSDDTTGNVNDNNALPPACADYTQVSGPDLVYSFTVGASNSVAFTVNPTNANYDTAIYVLGTCSDFNTCVTGADACVRSGATQPASCTDGTADEDLPARTYAPGTHAVFVDSFYAAGAACAGQGGVQCGAGPYTLTVTGSLPAELVRFEVE